MKLFKAGILMLIFTAFNFASVNTAAASQPAVSDVAVTSESELFRTFEKSILFGLESDVRGVVESTLYNAVTFKISYPEFSSDAVLQRISELAKNGENHSLRYKAYLTLAYYVNQDQFDEPETLAGMTDIRNQDKIFFYLQSEVQDGQLTSR